MLPSKQLAFEKIETTNKLAPCKSTATAHKTCMKTDQFPESKEKSVNIPMQSTMTWAVIIIGNFIS